MEEPAHNDLIRRVEAFDIDAGRPVLTFTARLARENGWTLSYAERVIREYKRFAILAITAGHPVSPSHTVDQAWHLHLTYTRSYWERFCRDVLQQDLHHTPTTGGSSEYVKHFAQYSQTLTSYERIFGNLPPADIWPDPVAHSHAGEDDRWMDCSRYWLFPRLQFRLQLKRSSFLFALVACMMIVAGCGAANPVDLNPFNLKGPEFLILYLPLVGIAIGYYFWGQCYYPADDREVPLDDFLKDPYLAAAITNGPKGVLLSALAGMVQDQHLVISKPRKSGAFFSKAPPENVLKGAPLPAGRPDIEVILYEAADQQGHMPFKKVIEAAVPVAKEFTLQLQTMGLADCNSLAPHLRTFPAIGIASLMAIGVIKAGVGIVRAKPIGFLGILIVFLGIMLVILTVYRRKRTPLGRRTRRELLEHFSKLNSEIKLAPTAVTTDLMMVAGLYGICSSTFFPEQTLLKNALTHHKVFNNGEFFGGHGSGCSSGGSGGCGGGGGGCGGGGCGGCGGG